MGVFGAQSDYWSYTASNAGLCLIDSSIKTVDRQRADAVDMDGDIVATAYYGNNKSNIYGDSIYEAKCEYVLVSGSLVLRTAAGGWVTRMGAWIYSGSGPTSKLGIIESVDITTSNTEFPKISVSGLLNTEMRWDYAGKTNSYEWPAAWTIYGRKQAQLYGANGIMGGRLQSCKVSAKVDVAQTSDGDGEPILFGVAGSRGTVDIEAVAVTAEPGLAGLVGGFTQINLDAAEKQASYHTRSFSLGFTMVRSTT